MPARRLFDLSRLSLEGLDSREHLLDISVVRPLAPVAQVQPDLVTVGRRLVAARQAGAARMFILGAHVLRSGVQRYLVDLMERGYISCLAGNGAVAIHDYEFALIGATTESVAKYIRNGRFGLWQETGRLNDIVRAGAEEGLGLGEAVGRHIASGDYPHKDLSVLAAAYRLGIPFTIHVGIGYDITHAHPNFDGAAYGKASGIDFLRFAAELEDVEGGVVMNFGSAVMGPEVYLKALSMVRNVARQEGRSVNRFTTLVCDLAPLPEGACHAEAERGTHGYYFRPWKTMLVRTVADGGESFYVRGPHADTLPMLWEAVGRSEALGDAT